MKVPADGVMSVRRAVYHQKDLCRRMSHHPAAF